MTINFDLLALACAEYCEHNGQMGVFIPEVPNFKYTPGTGTRRNASPPSINRCSNTWRTRTGKPRSI